MFVRLMHKAGLLFKSKELTTILQHTYDNVMTETQEHKTKSKRKCLLSHEDASLDEINNLQSPPRVNKRTSQK
ncbi:hypothetical protein Ahy_A06g027491 [Arachis hypogaea]|uniref:Uncharacterized protein n=1 Tax=Arachis hypogaea TaxID=3818 RepID=A0A445CNU8_ARAHY|nr:hypothetical protein Ahy_A06g027491 [Arachis hypogaea]